MNDILSITQGLSFDESIQEYQVHEYEPQTEGLRQLWFKDSTTDAEAENTGFAARKGYTIIKPTPKERLRLPYL